MQLPKGVSGWGSIDGAMIQTGIGIVRKRIAKMTSTFYCQLKQLGLLMKLNDPSVTISSILGV